MAKSKIVLKFLPLAAISAVFYFSSCWFLDPASELYRIHIDSVSVPTTVIYNSDTIAVKLWGKIGDDTCHSFAHYQAVQDSSSLELAVWGFFNPAYRKICPGADVQLGGREYRIWPLKRGIFTVTIRQPDGTVFKKFIEVI
jgi:hypothetical protein